MNQPRQTRGTLLLDRNEIAALVSLEDCLDVVESAFKAHALGETLGSGLLHVEAPSGEFHIKAGGLKTPSAYFALKANAGFFGNAERFGLPNIQGLVLLYDAENGRPLAVMDSLGITAKRTGAATAVAAKYLARPDSHIATICGCGTQARVQLRALAAVLPIERANAYSIVAGEAERFAAEMSEEMNIPIEPAADLGRAAAACDVCVTCTPARRFFLDRSFVAPGTFVAAVGADSPDKNELDPRLVAESTLVVDLLEQCATVGELHHAIEAGLMTKDDVHAELGEVVAGRAPGRSSRDEIVVFDSTGTALQDAAAAILAYERAIEREAGRYFDFASQA